MAAPTQPVVGVGAVIVHEDRVLLVKRKNPPLQGRWSLPGGRVELGETLAQAVVREVLEETGLVVSVGPLVDVIDRIHRDATGTVEYHFVLADYVCWATDVATAAAASDAADLRWASLEEMAQLGIASSTVAVIWRGVELARPQPRA